VKATGVIARFLSLLDIALILLGVLMVILMQAQLHSGVKQGSNQVDGAPALADIDFIYVYAGWNGTENGRCYLLGDDRKIGQEIRTDTADDIQAVLSARKASNQVVMLLFSDEGWYSAWDGKRVAEIEQAWKIKVIPVYNVQLSR